MAIALVGFAAVCLLAAAVRQVAAHRRWHVAGFAAWPGATDEWADELEAMPDAAADRPARRLPWLAGDPTPRVAGEPPRSGWCGGVCAW